MIGSQMDGDLWIVPTPENSTWFSRLDWYLNWQMCKGQTYRSKKPDASLLRITKEYELPLYDTSTEADAPLMIATQNLIPAKACLVMRAAGELKTWLLQGKAIACKMQAARVLIFLPSGAAKHKASKLWENLPGICTAEFIEDIIDDSMENA